MFVNKDHYLRSVLAEKPKHERILSKKMKFYWHQFTRTESGDKRKLSTGLLNCMRFKSSYVSNDHKQTVASWLPDTRTSLVELMATHTTGPRWWSIFITFFMIVREKEEKKRMRKISISKKDSILCTLIFSATAIVLIMPVCLFVGWSNMPPWRRLAKTIWT